MNRRRFLAASTAAATSTIRPVRADNCRFEDGKVEYQKREEILDSVQHFLVGDLVKGRWNREELAEEVSDWAKIPCYVLEKASDLADKLPDELPQIPGLNDIDFENLDENQEKQNWILERLEDLLEVVSHLDFLPDTVTNIAGSFDASKIRGWKRYVPFLWNLDGLLTVCCSIHEHHEKGKSIEKGSFKELFEHIGLLIVEIVLLFGSGGYSLAFKLTGKVNQKLITQVGRKVGWNVYSWLLSEIHWCIRIIYSESMDVAISESTETVARNLAKKTDMSKSCAKKQASDQVERIAEEGYLSEYTAWKNCQKQTDIIESAKEVASDFITNMNKWFNNLNAMIERWKTNISDIYLR
ncbi:hypothetical protein NP511_18100 [Natrinema thermotolerans]|uniref:Uncharacterized protein n=1 Tax=Natrinema thermotolerans TaxID=121872 RepID=A0AAF0PEN4_9EURY|nr:hypothetical protein [Natrinema thermotolerans]WMT07288.1 hypothetical protein NP511_18100 [Natrinema thermotolerans]